MSWRLSARAASGQRTARAQATIVARHRCWANKAALGVLLVCAACDPEAASGPAASASASAAASPSSSTSASARNYMKRPKAAETPSCRVMGVEGSAHVAHTTRSLKLGDLVESDAWLQLDKAGRLSLKHTQTGREWSVGGPAWLRACIDGQETLWLSQGELRIGTGAGARPGAQVVVSTPHGVVRWGDAALAIQVDTKQTRVAVSAGRVWLSAGGEAKLAGSAELGAKESSKLVAQGGSDRTEHLVAACEADARRAEQLAEALLSGRQPPPATPKLPASGSNGPAPSSAPRPADSASAAPDARKLGLGERARDQAAARGRARSSCAVAWASVGAEDSLALGKAAPGRDPAPNPFAARLRKADAAWRRVPFGGAKQPSDKAE